MRKRNYDIHFRLNNQEWTSLKKKYNLSGAWCLREFFLTLAQKGTITRLDFDYKELFKHAEELHKIGVNINQIAKVANQTQCLSKNQYLLLIEHLRDIKDLQERLYDKMDNIVQRERLD